MKSQGLSIRSLQILALLLAGALPLSLFLIVGESRLAPRLKNQGFDRIKAVLEAGLRQIDERTTHYEKAAETISRFMAEEAIEKERSTSPNSSERTNPSPSGRFY